MRFFTYALYVFWYWTSYLLFAESSGNYFVRRNPSFSNDVVSYDRKLVSSRGLNESQIEVSVKHGGELLRRRRFLSRKLGESCSKSGDCSFTSICTRGICSCKHDSYTYIPPHDPENSECRVKLKHGSFCLLTEDCKASDPRTVCFNNLCKCVNGTHHVSSLTYEPRCYKILERKGDQCEIDEQCSRLADNHHKCRCVGICDCTSIDQYGGCTICHENIKRTFFGGAAFIVLLLTSRLFSKMRSRTSSPQDRASTSNTTRRSAGQLLNSSTVPTVSSNGRNLRNNRRVALSLPNVFLIDRQNFSGLPSSQTTHFLPQSNSHAVASGTSNEDAPPSYEDIVERDQLVWNEPPPAYEEIALKCTQPRKP